MRGSAVLDSVASEKNGDPFDGRMLVTHLGAVKLCRIAALAHGNERMRQVVTHGTTPFYKLIFQVSGTLQVQHGTRRATIRPGEWSAYDVSKPYSVRNIDPLEQLAILLPKAAQTRHIENLLRRFPEQGFAISGMAQVLCATLRTTLANSDSVCDSVRVDLGAALSELAKLAILEQLQDSTAPTVQGTLRERIETYVRRNLRDPSLTVEAIADSLHYSKRYLHKAFHDRGCTLSQFIWDARLNGCGRDLADPDLAGHSITQIAFGWGFVNSAHFSRVFGAKFGNSPRAYRLAALSKSIDAHRAGVGCVGSASPPLAPF